MDEQALADCFSSDVDALLKDPLAEIEHSEKKPEEYWQAIKLARILAMVDFNDHFSIFKQRLIRLLNKFHMSEKSDRAKDFFSELDDNDLENVAGGTGDNPDDFKDKI